MPDFVKRLHKVYEVVKQIALVLKLLLFDDSNIEDLFYCVPAWPKTCLFFCQLFLSLGPESVEDNSEHDLAGMADQADGTRILSLLEVAFLW